MSKAALTGLRNFVAQNKTILMLNNSGAGTIFGLRGKIGNDKLMGSLSNLDRVFVPEISVL